MWILTYHYCCRSNIQTRRYQSCEEVVHDIELVYSNCELYNAETSTICKDARRQRIAFKKFIERLEKVQ